MKKRIGALLILVFLTACGASDNGLTPKDLAIQKVDNKKATVHYGMSRADAEKVLGEGEEAGLGKSFSYGGGVTVMYRGDKVAGVALNEGSEKAYETVEGLRVGMSEEDTRKVYGEHYLNNAEKFIDYAYDSSNKQFLQGTEWAKKFADDSLIYLISVMLDGEKQVSYIMLTDRKMAMTYR